MSKPEKARGTHYWLILQHLKERGSASSAELNDRFNALQSPGTIRALRRDGHAIRTVWTYDTDEDGVVHRCAKYHYLGGPTTEIEAANA